MPSIRNITSFFILFYFSSLSASLSAQPIDWEAHEQKAKALLPTLTLEDKVGEMTQLSIDAISVGEPYQLEEPHQLDPDKLQRVLVDLRVGSILNVGGHAYTRAEWEQIIGTIQDVATTQKLSGIPVLYGIDAIHGTNYTMGATLYPQQIGLATTWNPELAKQLGEVTAYETRASGIPWNFSPVMDMGRDPRWSRFWETFGEDVLLASRLGVAMLEGYQGDDPSNPYRVASSLKHFLGYSAPRTGRDRTQALLPERQLREYYVPPFQAGIDAGALTVMINSGEMNGVPTHCNKAILTDLLRKEMGFRGLAVTDWEDISYLHTRHRVAKDFKESIKLAINAGIDMAMVPMDTRFPVLLKELVEEGEVPMSRIDESVTRILAVKYALGLFEHPYYDFSEYPDFGSDKHIALAKQAAQESIVLLKNEKRLLPLSNPANVLVTGPTAHSLRSLNGGWTGTWQGDDPKYYNTNALTILDALTDRLGEGKVDYVPGTTFNKEVDIQAAAQAAKNKDVAIICLGESSYTEKPGDLNDLNLPMPQSKLVEAIAATGTPVVLVLAEGRPRVARSAIARSDAVLGAFLPGDYGGEAIADVILGTVNPGGKLPFTYPRYANALLTYDHRGTDLIDTKFGENAFQPQFEFGHGLSYTRFQYSDLKLDKTEVSLGKGEELTVSVMVSNKGRRSGYETIQLYATDQVASITPSVRRLRDFKKINLDAGESRLLTFQLSLRDLAFVGLNQVWVTEPGKFKVSIGGLEAEFEVVE